MSTRTSPTPEWVWDYPPPGAVSSSRFVAMLRRNTRKMDWHLVQSRWGRRAGVPTGNMTIWHGPEEDGMGFNLACPSMPYKLVRHSKPCPRSKKHRIRHRSWKGQLKRMVDAGMLRDTQEVRLWLRR